MKSSLVRLAGGVAAAVGLIAAGAVVDRAPALSSIALQAQDCARHYVAGGDHYPAGHELLKRRNAIPTTSAKITSNTWGLMVPLQRREERDNVSDLHQRRPACADMEPAPGSDHADRR